MKKLLKSQKGSTLVIFGLSAVVLFGFVALVADIGMMTLHRAKLSNAVDAAALAGAQELIYNAENAPGRAAEYFRENGYADSPIDVAIDEDQTAIRVTASHEVNFGLARVLGFSSENVQATVKGKVLPVIAVNSGTRPFAIQDQELEFGAQYTLKRGGGNGSGGNYGGIALGGNGAKIYLSPVAAKSDAPVVAAAAIAPASLQGILGSEFQLLILYGKRPRATVYRYNGKNLSFHGSLDILGGKAQNPGKPKIDFMGGCNPYSRLIFVDSHIDGAIRISVFSEILCSPAGCVFCIVYQLLGPCQCSRINGIGKLGPMEGHHADIGHQSHKTEQNNR